MKASELRLGNLLMVRCHTINLPIFNNWTLEKVNYHHVKAMETFDKTVELKPIPLTEEWLYKLGFSWYGNWDAFVVNRDSNKELSIIKHKDIFIVCDVNLTPEIKYVHQLQNLYFALTGEELIIKEQ